MSVKYSEIFDRILQAGNFKNGAELARSLNITPQAISNYKKRGEMPADLVLKFARTFGVSIDWLLTGEGSMQNSGITRLNGKEPIRAITAESISMDLNANPDELIYIGKLLKVLRGPEKYAASSIKLSIDAFLNAIDGTQDKNAIQPNESQEAARLVNYVSKTLKT